jgi:hypothetical protein
MSCGASKINPSDLKIMSSRGMSARPISTMRRMNLKICLIGSEVAPFSKTGGLADVCGALTKYLQAEPVTRCASSRRSTARLIARAA